MGAKRTCGEFGSADDSLWRELDVIGDRNANQPRPESTPHRPHRDRSPCRLGSLHRWRWIARRHTGGEPRSTANRIRTSGRAPWPDRLSSHSARVQWLRGRCSSNIRPSWKIRTIAPKVAAIDSRLLSTAFRTTARAKCQRLAPSVDVVVSMDGARAQRKLSAGISSRAVISSR